MSEGTLRDAFFKRVRHHPQLSDAPPEAFGAPVLAHRVGRDMRYPPLRTPILDDKGSTVLYEILDLENHMDSSEMTPSGECEVARVDEWRALELLRSRA